MNALDYFYLWLNWEKYSSIYPSLNFKPALKIIMCAGRILMEFSFLLGGLSWKGYEEIALYMFFQTWRSETQRQRMRMWGWGEAYLILSCWTQEMRKLIHHSLPSLIGQLSIQLPIIKFSFWKQTLPQR